MENFHSCVGVAMQSDDLQNTGKTRIRPKSWCRVPMWPRTENSLEDIFSPHITEKTRLHERV